MHIHPSSPNSSEENAAVKIQAGFRGYRVRKQLKQKPHRRFLKMAANGSVLSQLPSSDDSSSPSSPSLEEQCATKIQAGVRGFLVRKKHKAEAEAATKIQAGFRGFKVRREMKEKKDN